MTRPWIIEAKLYAALTRYPERLWSLGLEADTECLPWRILWRDSLSGESGVVCKFLPDDMNKYVNITLQMLKRIRESEKRLNQPMLWPKEYLRTKAKDAWKRKAVAA